MSLWPSREIIDMHMPEDFKSKFPNTRVILDATEIPIQKPSHVDAQSVTWSSYKHKNTMKSVFVPLICWSLMFLFMCIVNI